ncbi:hypothetical protein ACOSQ3_003319 [Xanthoceras sorbifolium]
MDLQMNINRVEDEYEDWKGRKADSKKYGGIRAASFACVVEVLENTVFLCNASNFVAYFLKSMHYSAAESANTVTNFMATSFLLTIFGGFISDSFLTRFTTFILFCTIELLVWIIYQYFLFFFKEYMKFSITLQIFTKLIIETCTTDNSSFVHSITTCYR